MVYTIQSIRPETGIAMLHFQIDPHTGIPVYRQMVDQVKYYVASGALKVGDQLPSIRELAQTLAINPTTVVRAYSELAEDKVIEMQHGRGVFVSDTAPRMSSGEREKALRRLARQLAVEGTQMGASTALIVRVLNEELSEVRGETEEGETPAKRTVVSRR